MIYSKEDIDKLNIDFIKKVLVENNKTWIKSYVKKHGFNKIKLTDFMNGNFTSKNYPEIEYWKTHHFNLFKKAIERAIVIYYERFNNQKVLNMNKYNIGIIRSILSDIGNPWLKKTIDTYFTDDIILKNTISSFYSYKIYKMHKHLHPELKNWGPRKYQYFSDIIKEVLITHDNITRHLPKSEIFSKALEMNFLNYKNINLIKEDYSSLELALLCFPKYSEILKDYLINSLTLLDISKKYSLTRERVRQITSKYLKESQFVHAYKFYVKNNFEELNSDFNKNIDVVEFKYNKKGEYRMGPNIQDPYQEIMFLLEGEKKYKIFKFYSGESVYINKEIFKTFNDNIKNLNKDLSNIGFYRINRDNNEFVEFIKSKIDLLIPTLKSNNNFLYIPTKIKLLNIANMAIDANTINSLVDIQGVLNWIKKNFPEKVPSGIVSLRNQLLRNKLIFAYGKTGKYEKVSKKGQKTLHTLDAIIEILSKSKHPLHQNEIQELVQKQNPYLKDRGTTMIIEINLDKFVKFKGTGFVGLKGKEYSKLPRKLPKKEINKYLSSKSLSVEWLSFEYLINEYDINDYQLIDFIEESNDYIYLDNLITLSTNNLEKDKLIKKLCRDERLIPYIKNSYDKKEFTLRLKFIKKLKKIIQEKFSTKLSEDNISKIINFII